MLGALAFFLMLESCTYRVTDFTVISTKNVPLTESGNGFKKSEKRVKGTDVAHSVLVFSGRPNMKEAIDKAIEKYPGAVGLVDGVVKYNTWTCFFYGQSKYIIEGSPLYPADSRVAKAQSYIDNIDSYPVQTQENKSVQIREKEQDETFIFYHEVKAGETLSSIAKQYGVTIANLVKWNKLNTNELSKGSKLKIYLSE